MHKKGVLLIDPLSIRQVSSTKSPEIEIPGRRLYTGSPVAVREPIAIEYIASYLEKFGYRTFVILRGMKKDEEIISIAKNLREELLAIGLSIHSTYLVPSTLELTMNLKKVCKDIPIIVGGYHPTGDPMIVTNKNIDYAVIGEGEVTCRKLLEAIERKNNPRFVKGIAFTDEKGEVVITQSRKRLEFSKLPWPKRSSEIIDLCEPGPLSFPPYGKVAQISYSRGCPYFCRFCASPKIWRGIVKFRDADDVTKEMEYLIDHFNINNFFFCDLSFNSDKEKLIKFCRRLHVLKNKKQFGCHVMCTISNIDVEMLYEMRDAGITKIDFGVEAVIEYTLRSIKPMQNIDMIKKVLKLTSDSGILTRVLMMVGYPWESRLTLSKTKEILLGLPIDQLRLCYYVPFVGTEIYDELKERIIVGYEDLNTEKPAIKCDGVSSKDLEKAVAETIHTFYNSKQYASHVEAKLRKHSKFRIAFKKFFEYLKQKNIIDNSSPAWRYYSINLLE